MSSFLRNIVIVATGTLIGGSVLLYMKNKMDNK